MYKALIGETAVAINTCEGIFSPSGPDKGTLAMLREAAAQTEGTGPLKILDLGCGTGIVGVYLGMIFKDAEIHFTDVDERAVELSRENALANGMEDSGIKAYRSDAFENILDRDFDMILSNPPYHTDFAVAKAFIEGAFRHLALGGKLFMVTKRLDWYKNKLIHVFGGVRITRTEDGYFVFTAEKRSERPANTKPVKKR